MSCSLRSAGDLQDANEKNQEQAARLEEAAKRIDELTQERASLERANVELRNQLKEQRKAHQGTMDRMLNFVSLTLAMGSENCSSPQKLRKL